MDKKDKIIKWLLENGNILNKQNINEIKAIDPDFDFNLFKLQKTPIQVLYIDDDSIEQRQRWNKSFDVENIKNLNYSNANSISINFPFKFRREDDFELIDDMNIFFRDIDKVIYIEEIEDRYKWSYTTLGSNKKIIEKPFFYVRFDDNKKNKNLKTFRFILHSISNMTTNMNNDKYFINGREISYAEFKKISRSAKLKKLINEQLQ